MKILLKSSQKQGKKIVPLVPLRRGVVFPHTEVILNFGRQKSLTAVETAFRSDRLICFVSQKDPTVDNPTIRDVYQLGTLCLVQRILKTNGEIDALVKGVARIKVEEIHTQGSFLSATVSEVPEITEESDEIKALVKYLTGQLKKAIKFGKTIEFLVFMRLMSDADPAELADQVANILELKTREKQKLLEIPEVKLRLEKVGEHLSRELKILEIEHSIKTKTQKKFDKSMREAVLRERLKTIQKELGTKEEDREIREYREKIEAAKMPETKAACSYVKYVSRGTICY